jgi:hypothetical protein
MLVKRSLGFVRARFIGLLVGLGAAEGGAVLGNLFGLFGARLVLTEAVEVDDFAHPGPIIFSGRTISSNSLSVT